MLSKGQNILVGDYFDVLHYGHLEFLRKTQKNKVNI